mgnify:CR=1 FL=1
MGQKGDKEASDGFWPQKEEVPSTKLKRGPKHGILQLVTKPKTVHMQA